MYWDQITFILSAAWSKVRTTPSYTQWLDRQDQGLENPKRPRQGWHAQTESAPVYNHPLELQPNNILPERGITQWVSHGQP